MAYTSKITSKGQVTIPKEMRDLIKTNFVRFEFLNDFIILKPVRDVGGALSKYAKSYVPLAKIRDQV